MVGRGAALLREPGRELVRRGGVRVAVVLPCCASNKGERASRSRVSNDRSRKSSESESTLVEECSIVFMSFTGILYGWLSVRRPHVLPLRFYSLTFYSMARYSTGAPPSARQGRWGGAESFSYRGGFCCVE